MAPPEPPTLDARMDSTSSGLGEGSVHPAAENKRHRRLSLTERIKRASDAMTTLAVQKRWLLAIEGMESSDSVSSVEQQSEGVATMPKTSSPTSRLQSAPASPKKQIYVRSSIVWALLGLTTVIVAASTHAIFSTPDSAPLPETSEAATVYWYLAVAVSLAGTVSLIGAFIAGHRRGAAVAEAKLVAWKRTEGAATAAAPSSIRGRRPAARLRRTESIDGQ